MEKKKLITALMVGCMAFLPAGAAASTISGVIENQINTGTTPGVATVNAGDTLIIDDATIRNNSGYGGAFVNHGTIHINDGEEGSHTTFSGNSNNNPTMGGGAIYSYTTGSTKVYVGHYTSFENNSSSYTDADGKHGDSGGAIYVGNATLEIGSNVNFSDNEAISGRVDSEWGTVAYGGHGGAIYAIDSDVTIGNDLNVVNNKSIYSGGGAYFHNTSGTHSVITIGTGAIFTGNESLEENGGAIGNKNNTLTIGAGAEFTNNTAAQSGGAIYNTATVNVNGATFTGNKAKNGGALYNAQNATASLQDVTFSAASGDASNSIYNAGSVTTASTGSNVNIFSSNITTVKDWTYTGKNVVEGAIDGYGTITNEGNTTFAGNNSLYTGSFTQSDSNAETTVTGTFFGGTSTVSDGTLNWETQTGIPSGGSLNITGGKLNIGSAVGQTTGTFTVGANSVIGNAVNVQVNKNSVLANDTNLTLGGEFINNSGAKVQGTGELAVTEGSNAGTITQDSFTVNNGGADKTFSNSGTIDTNTVTNNGNLNNTGAIGSSDNKVTEFTNNGTFTNEGSLIAETINNNTGTLTNKEGSTLSADTFNNAATIEGTGELTLGSGENTGSITQSAITIATGGEYTNASGGTMIADTISISTNSKFNNEGSLGSATSSVGEIINDGIFTNTGNNSSIYANKIVNNENATFKTENQNIVAGEFVNLGTYEGSGSSALDGGENTGNYTDDVVTIDGSYNNTGSIIANETFTNTGTITGNTDVAGEIAGSIIVNDTTGTSSNSGSITQDSVKITGTFENTGSITVNDFTNSGTITDSNSAIENSSITINNTGKNTGSITQDAITIATGRSFTSGDGGTNQASVTVNNLTNNGIVTLNNSILSVITGNVTTGTINVINSGNQLNANLTGGNLNLLNGSQLTIDGSSNIADAVALDIQNGATLTLNRAELKLDNADQWDGKIINQAGGTINADGLVNNSDTASLIQQGGELNVYNDAHLTLGEGSKITGGEIYITKGTNGENGSTFTLANGKIEDGNMTIDKDSSFIVKNGTFNLNSISGAGEVDADGVMHAALVDAMNGQRTQHSITNLAIDGQTNFNLDIHARGNHYTSNDQFVVSSMTGDGTARVDNWGLNGDIFGWDAPIDRHITLDHIFVDENGNPLQGNIEITRKTEFTPIGYYQLNQKGSGTGLHYTLDLVDFNPQVFRGQVATVAQWMNQLAIDDMLFTHSMVLPSFKDEDGGVAYSGVMANRYASSNPLFAPYQYSRKDGGLWYKMYGTFENLNMNVSGLGRVGNNAYGALIGADFGLKELKNGWKFMPTAYVGYNGAHQAYPGIGAYQNGGQAGFLGTWYKNNFILGGLVYGGVYENSMDVGGHTDNAFNYFAGAATKLAYNWRFHRDWVLQPNLMAAYNFFGQQNWHSDYGQMGMMAGMLNGVNLAPGVNLIWEKETFSIYGTLQYMYNLNGAVGGRAGNVGLPQVEMERGYIQYGLGFTKRWGDRFSGYLQAVLRNAGRTGVGFQLGFNFLLGK